MWQGISTITDYKNELNKCFGWFEALNDTPAMKVTSHHDNQVLSLDPADV